MATWVKNGVGELTKTQFRVRKVVVSMVKLCGVRNWSVSRLFSTDLEGNIFKMSNFVFCASIYWSPSKVTCSGVLLLY